MTESESILRAYAGKYFSHMLTIEQQPFNQPRNVAAAEIAYDRLYAKACLILDLDKSRIYISPYGVYNDIDPHMMLCDPQSVKKVHNKIKQIFKNKTNLLDLLVPHISTLIVGFCMLNCGINTGNIWAAIPIFAIPTFLLR